MFKAVSTFLVVAGSASASYGPQYQQPYQQYHPYQQYQQTYQYAPSKTIDFGKPHALIDPKYYKEILSDFTQCKAHKCDKLGRGYATDVKTSISVLGDYTSCITACAAEQMFKAVQDLKSGLAKYNDIGFAHLTRARKYIAGTEDYDILEEKARIGESCCLPKDYFAPWEQITIPVSTTVIIGDDETPTTTIRMISVDAYLKKCKNDIDEEWIDAIDFECGHEDYLAALHRNVGHLILAPKCEQLTPDGACSEGSLENPRVAEFGDDVCVAYECIVDGKKVNVDIPFIKDITPGNNWDETCPSEKTESGFEIVYERVHREKLEYYTVTTGLPTLGEGCAYTAGLATPEGRFFIPTTPEDPLAPIQCPADGLFEYCNAEQFTSFLQRQLFDNDGCQVGDITGNIMDDLFSTRTLSCMYKLVTLKCDCMQAVLNCYEHGFKYEEPLAQTIGKAASILCGFILCQRPEVYALFGGQSAIERAHVLRGLMSQVGLAAPTVNSLPPATFAFLSFGLGMVAFVVTKYANKSRKPIAIEEGYRNLI